MSENLDIPDNWKIIQVKEIGNLLRGVTYRKEHSSNEPLDDHFPILRANNINSDLNFEDLVYVYKKYIDDIQFLRKGDIIFAMSSGSKHLVGKSAKVKIDFKGSYGAFCAVFRAFGEVNRDFVAYFFQAPLYKQHISSISKGTNINNLKREHILDLDFPLPPLCEQQRIVTKIEELFSSLDKGIESLKNAQEQLKIYRQAVLKWAFAGKLTNDDVKEGELPDGWRWAVSVELFEYITSGSRGWAQYYSDDGAIFLRMGNLDHNTVLLDLSDIQYVNLPNKAEGLRSLVYPGDILISITADVGMIALVPDNFPEAYINQHIALARPKSSIINSKYLAWYLASEKNGQNQLRELQRGATKVGLGLDDIRSVKVPLCPLDEQQLIVAEIESRLSVCDKLEESITQSLQQAEALRQSILKKAFEGKLVPQDPNDEPASVLLERIRTERNAAVAKNATAAQKNPRKKARAS